MIFNPLQNFAAYRERLTSTKPPFIPFQSRILGDLTGMEQIDTYLPSGAVNFHKMTEIGQVLKLVELAQSVEYPFIELPDLKKYLQYEIFFLSKDVMFPLSEHCLGKNSK